LHSSPNVIKIIESGRMGWAGHVACMGEYIKVWVKKNLKETDYLGRTRGRWEDKTETDLNLLAPAFYI